MNPFMDELRALYRAVFRLLSLYTFFLGGVPSHPVSQTELAERLTDER